MKFNNLNWIGQDRNKFSEKNRDDQLVYQIYGLILEVVAAVMVESITTPEGQSIIQNTAAAFQGEFDSA